MQLELPRTGLNGSALVEMLAQLALGPRPAAPPSFVDGLGRWLGWKDAIGLSAVLQALPLESPPAPAQPPSRGGADAAPIRRNGISGIGSIGGVGGVDGSAALAALAALEAEFTRVRTALALTMQLALDDAASSEDSSSSFLPWRRCCFRLQQAMEAAVGPLRARARAVLQAQAAMHPALGTLAALAALDAALASMLAPREQAQLALMPVLLERHFVRLAVHGDRSAPSPFRHDMQGLLQAELELRLQPALGLLDALRAAQTGTR